MPSRNPADSPESTDPEVPDFEPSENAPRSGPEESVFSVLSIGSLAILLVVILGFKDFVLDANNIPSGSMIPTLKIGDYLFVNKMRYSLRVPFAGTELWHIDDPVRGDIITFIPPYEREKHYVKRVIGVPGDRIRIRPVRLCDLAADLARSSQPTPQALATLEREQAAGTESSAEAYRELCQNRTSRWQEPLVAVVEHRPGDRGPWQNYGPRPLTREETRAILTDSDNVGVLQPEQWPENSYDRTLPVLLKETVGDREHLFVEKHLPAEASRAELCPDVETAGCLIPEDGYFVMGDNRDDSKDSRMIGYIRRPDILGKALMIYFSINWYDEVCKEYWNRFEGGLSSLGDTDDLESDDGFRLADFPPEDQATSCKLADTQTYQRSNESRLGFFARYLWHTISARVPRMDVRWDRPATYLE